MMTTKTGTAGATRKRGTRRASRLVLLGGALAAVLLVVLPAGLVVPPALDLRHRFSETQALASSPGGKDVRATLKTLRTDVVGAKKDLAAIQRVRMSVGWPAVSLATLLPGVGPPVRAGEALMYAGLDLLEAAEEALLASEEVLPAQPADNPDKPPSLIPALKAATPHIRRAARLSQRAQERLANVNLKDLPDPLGPRLYPLVQRLPSFSKALQLAAEAMGPLPSALGEGGERRYLILAQDQGELRSTGGFIGNYGLLTLKDGRIEEFYLRDVALLDRPFYNATGGFPLHPVFMRYLPEATWWGLRDSNISPDFPTAAGEAERLFVAEGGAPAVDGVIAITINTLKVLLKAVGPVQVPEFGETVTVDNVEERIRYHQYNPPPPQVKESLGIQRKLFTALLAQAVFQRISDLGPADLLPLLGSWEHLLRAKDVQVYFNDPDLQKVALMGDFAGQIKDPWGDYLFIVDSNLSGDKANIYVKQSAHYRVQFGEGGTVTAQLTLHYDYISPGNIYRGEIKRDFYGDYLRVYVPYGSVLQGSQGVDHEVQTSWELGKTVFSTFLEIRPGTERTVTLRYVLPFLTTSWTDGNTSQPPGGHGRYELAIQKQAGTDITSVQVEVDLPRGIEVTQPGPFQARDGQIFFEGALDGDLLLMVRLKGL